MSYKCSGCTFSTQYITSIKNHIARKNKCSEGVLEIQIIDADIRCTFCDTKLSNNNSLSRHLKTCKEKLKIELYDRKKDKEIAELKKELKKERSKNAKAVAKTINNTTNNNTMTNSNNTNTINNYITISLTPYNDPNMEGMQQYLEAAIRKTFLSVPTLIENIHFNKEYPENHNICITNRRTKDARVFDGKRWKTINKDLLLNEMVDTYERELTNFAEEKGNTKYIKNYESAKKRGNAEKDLVDEVHNVIYDNSEMVNTKIKEVVKPIQLKDESSSEEDNEESSIHDTDQSEGSESEQVDEYDEFRKQLEDSDESEPESD
jgi:hypothetical protein